MNRGLLLLTLCFAYTLAGCVCPFACNWGYRQSSEDCTCWCQQTALSMGEPNPTCSYLPSGPGSPGGCLLCGNTIRSTTFADAIFENNLTNAVMGSTSDGDILFPIRRCTCPYGCRSGYSGSYDMCLDYAERQAHRFLDNKYTVKYIRSGIGSPGGCVVCGKTDPCARF
ncbi:hypothetical protein GEMRC1_008148 [Eukaryota sp. GEM-RC1]